MLTKVVGNGRLPIIDDWHREKNQLLLREFKSLIQAFLSPRFIFIISSFKFNFFFDKFIDIYYFINSIIIIASLINKYKNI